MPQNAVILYDNRTLQTGVQAFASSEASTDLGVTNLLNADPAVRWRSTGCASETVTLTWPDPGVDFRFIGLVNHNFTFDAQVQISLATMTEFGFDVVLSAQDLWGGAYGLGEGRLGIDPLGGYLSAAERADLSPVSLIDLSSVYGARSLKMTFTDPANPDGFLTFGVPYVDVGLQPSANFYFNWQLGWIDPSTQVRLEGGGARTIKRTAYRTLQLPFGFIEEAEGIQFFDDIHRIAGLRNHVLVSAFPQGGTAAEPRTTLYGLLRQMSGITQPNYGIYSSVISVDEVRG